FGFDTTGSMSAELTAMKNVSTGVPAIIHDLRCLEAGTSCVRDDDCAPGNLCFSGSCIADPLVAGCIPDLWTGLGTWDDLDTYRNRISLQADPLVTANAIPTVGG